MGKLFLLAPVARFQTDSYHNSMSTQIKSLQEAINTPAGSYVSGGFQAVVANAKTLQSKAGKAFYKAKLQEGGITVDATSFTTDFAPFVGKLTKWVGMGIKRGDDYNGVPQFSIGDKARWIPAGDAPTQPVQQPQASHSAPATQSGAQGAMVINGQTVGMAVKGALDVCLKTGDYSEELVWRHASALIRVSDRLQKGDLAPAEENAGQEENAPF